MVEPERPQIAIWRRIASWISKATRAQEHAHAPTHIHKHATRKHAHAHTQTNM